MKKKKTSTSTIIAFSMIILGLISYGAKLWWLLILSIIVGAIALGIATTIEKETRIAEKLGDMKTRGNSIDDRIECGRQTIIIDYKKSEMVVINSDYDPVTVDKTVKFADITRYEIYENGNAVQSGRVGSAAIGAALFGPTGAIVGASRSKKISNICNTLELVIYTSLKEMPAFSLTFIKHGQNKTDSFAVSTEREKIRRLVGILDNFIITKQADATSSSAADELEKLFKLYKAGAITEDEYKTQKDKVIRR